MYFKIYQLGILLLFAVFNQIQFINSESIGLLKVESDIISGLEKYINDYESQINKLKSNLEELQKEHEEANEDVTRYLSNPINAYLLTKRLTTDWKHVESLISNDKSLEFFKNISSNYGEKTLPDEEDLRNEILRLDHLRRTYALPISEVANGYLGGVKYSDPLKSIDCFEIGRQLYYTDEIKSSDEWLALAAKMFDYEHYSSIEDGDTAKASILDYYSMTQFKLGNLQTAINLAGEAIKLNPDFDHIKDNIKKIRRAILDDKSVPKSTADKKSDADQGKSEDQKKYEKGCRGTSLKSPSQLKELYCEMFSGKSAFLKLAPFKLEIVNLSPKIVLAYDILNDKEIQKFLNISENKMSTATLLEQYKGVEVAYPTVSSQYYMVNGDEIALAYKLNKRLSDLTGLNAKSEGESFQMSKYVVGGHYAPQRENVFKVGDKPIDSSDEYGNRISSSIIYLSNVEKGGATIFPKVDTVVFPQKGAALIWYNTLLNGKVDLDVQHTGCPVLQGNNWILTKSIREKDQMMIRPCSLNENDRHE